MYRRVTTAVPYADMTVRGSRRENKSVFFVYSGEHAAVPIGSAWKDSLPPRTTRHDGELLYPI